MNEILDGLAAPKMMEFNLVDRTFTAFRQPQKSPMNVNANIYHEQQSQTISLWQRER